MCRRKEKEAPLGAESLRGGLQPSSRFIALATPRVTSVMAV